MNRGFMYLLAATILALLAVVALVPREQSAGDSAVNALLLPGLAGTVNEVDRVDIVTAGNTIVATLVRIDDLWKLEQMQGYRADWPRLQGLLAGLAQAKVIEVKTDKPAYYARLGVEDVAAEDADSVLVRLANGDAISSILVGHQAQGRAGQYVRLQDTAASALLDRTLDVSTEQLDWADRRIVDVSASEVAEVEIIHSEEGRVFISKISADQIDFDLVELPSGREIRSSWAVNSLGSVLSSLDLESVRSADSIDWQAAVRMRMLLFSGLEIMAEMVEADGYYLLRLNASHPAAQVVEYKSNPDDSAGDNEALVQQAVADVAKRVTDINQRVNGWAYGIEKQKYEAMMKTQEDVLKPIESS